MNSTNQYPIQANLITMHIPIMKAGLLRALISAAMLAACGVVSAVAQTGSIAGKVKDTRTGQYLENARVTVESTNARTLTDSFGQFRINNVQTRNNFV